MSHRNKNYKLTVERCCPNNNLYWNPSEWKHWLWNTVKLRKTNHCTGNPSIDQVDFLPFPHWILHKNASCDCFGNFQNAEQARCSTPNGMRHWHSQGGDFSSFFILAESNPWTAKVETSDASSKACREWRRLILKSTSEVLGSPSLVVDSPDDWSDLRIDQWPS